MNRIEQALRKVLAEMYGFDLDAYRCRIETMPVRGAPALRFVTFYRPGTGACIQIDNVESDRGGWPERWSHPELIVAGVRLVLRQYLEEDKS